MIEGKHSLDGLKRGSGLSNEYHHRVTQVQKAA
jgi:hypothetical protein